MHVPEPSQDRLQHSKGPVHAAPPGRQASQVPEPPQCIVQQSASPVQAPPSGTQHPTPYTSAPRHSRPGQQAFRPKGEPRSVTMHVPVVQQVWSGWQRSVPEHANGGSQRVATQDPLKSGAGIRMENGLQQPTIWVLGPP